MGPLAIPIIMLVLLGIFGVFFLVVTKKQKEGLDRKDNNSREKSSKNDKTHHEMRKEDVFNFMEFDEISDNMIIQNKGTRYTMMIQCKGINYDLMSDVEQLAVEEGFITFLNTLTSPIQLYVQAQNLDLKGTIKVYKEHVDKIKEEFDNVNQEYNRINEAFDSTKDEIKNIERERNKTLNVYEYASDIVNYVERISLNKSLLQRTFFVLVSYNSSEISSIDRFSKEEVRNICYNELVTRAQSIINGLASCSVAGRILNSNEIADVLYTAYNRDDKGLMNVKEALESGFYRLYSTSEDIFLKKQKKLQEEIDNEARIKALETLKESIKEGEYISPRIQQLDIEEQISKKASEIVRYENVPIDIKERANEKLINEFRKTKKNILDKAAIEYKELTDSLGIDMGLNNDIEETKTNPDKNIEDRIDNSSNIKEIKDDKDNEEEKKIENNKNIVENDVNLDINKLNTKTNSDSDNNNINLEDDINISVQNNDTKNDFKNNMLKDDDEPKVVVEKKKIEDSAFEYNNEQANRNRDVNNLDINLSGGFDDRLGSSEDDSII